MLLFYVLATRLVFAENNSALALYGIQSAHFKCDDALRAFAGLDSIRFSFLWNTFGTNLKCVSRLMVDPRFKSIQVHLVNEVCQRNARCGTYELAQSVGAYATALRSKDPKFLKKATKYVAPLADFLYNNLPPQSQCLISPGLESNLPSAWVGKLVQSLKPLFPTQCAWVWNPNISGTLPAWADFLEIHGTSPKLTTPCVANLDGQDISWRDRRSVFPSWISWSDIPVYFLDKRQCTTANLWSTEMNGNLTLGFHDPRTRTHFGDRALFAKFNALLQAEAKRPLPPIPAWSTEDQASLKGCRTVKWGGDGEHGGFLWKQSDSYPGAVALLPVTAKSVVVQYRGKILSTLRYAYEFQEDSTRRKVWRSSLPCPAFPYHSVLKADSQCWVLENPKARID